MSNLDVVLLCANNAVNYEKCRKKLYTVKLTVPPLGTAVYNKLEGSSYVTSEQCPFVLTGTVGEQWVIDFNKLCRTYVVASGKRPITENDIDRLRKSGKQLTLQTITNGDINYCYKVPVNTPFEIITSWGTTLLGNREGVPHDTGDYIVCSVLNGQPNLSDRWIVNGEVFKNTYKLLE